MVVETSYKVECGLISRPSLNHLTAGVGLPTALHLMWNPVSPSVFMIEGCNGVMIFGALKTSKYMEAVEALPISFEAMQ